MKLLIASYIATIFFFSMTTKKELNEIPPSDQSNKPIFSFGVLADVQFADSDPVGTRFYRSSTLKLREALFTLKRDSVQFILNLGDIIDHDFNSYKTVLDIIDSSETRIYSVTGNHDFSVDPKLKKKIPVLPPSKDSYYSIVYKGFRFIFLNGNEVSTYATKNKNITKQASDLISQMKEKGEINAVDWNGGISSKQITWMEAQLEEAKLKLEKVFIVCHFPLVPENVHNLLNYKKVLSVLENYDNIIAWFNGHNHAGNYGNFNMTHFITFKGMVETENLNSFALVEVYSNKIWIKGFGREKSMILAY